MGFINFVSRVGYQMHILIYKSRKQNGISVLELLLAAIIIIILGLIAVRYYQSSLQNQRINDTLSLLSGFIAAETQWSLQNKNKYSQNIKNLIDNSYLTRENTLSPWTGQPIVYEQIKAGASFKIILYKIKSHFVCNRLANSINDNIEGGNAFCESTTLSFVYS
jgi:type II secretory pathway pseudopilin PulG